MDVGRPLARFARERAFDDLPPEVQQRILADQRDGLLAAQGGVTALRAELGTTQARLDAATSRHQSQVTALNIAKSGLVSVDPYQTATELEAVRLQLETLYSVTARVSRLTLAAFLS